MGGVYISPIMPEKQRSKDARVEMTQAARNRHGNLIEEVCIRRVKAMAPPEKTEADSETDRPIVVQLMHLVSTTRLFAWRELAARHLPMN